MPDISGQAAILSECGRTDHGSVAHDGAMATETAEICYCYEETPLGKVLLTAQNGALSGVYFTDHSHSVEPRTRWRHTEAPFRQVRAQLVEYFDGGRTDFDLPLALHGSPFELTVWNALRGIPYGKTVSYGHIALTIGRPTAARAVGAANGRNPVCIVVPCHRVIGADGSLTGYGWGVDRKVWLLDHERPRAGAPGASEAGRLFHQGGSAPNTVTPKPSASTAMGSRRRRRS